MTATHQAIVRDGSRSSIHRRPTPRPGRGEIVVAPEKVSLCGTDIQIVRGDRDDPSPIVGHEGAARVVAVGADVDSVTAGRRVVINPTHPGDPSFLLGHNVDGLFQQRVLIGASAVRAGLVAPIGESISSARATLIEPWAVVQYALRAMAATRPDTLLVIGDGLIGNLAAYLAPRVFGSEARTVMLHRTEEGRAWTAGFAPSVHGRAVDSSWEDDCGDAVALLVSTHRDATAAAVDRAVDRLGSRLVAVHPIGGVPAGSVCRTLPGVDLAGVRAANTGGPWPPASVRFDSGDQQVVCTGNRGATTQRLRTAADELAAEAAEVDSLLTHDVDLTAGVEVMNALCGERRRTIDGRRVLRLVVTMNSELVRE